MTCLNPGTNPWATQWKSVAHIDLAWRKRQSRNILTKMTLISSPSGVLCICQGYMLLYENAQQSIAMVSGVSPNIEGLTTVIPDL